VTCEINLEFSLSKLRNNHGQPIHWLKFEEYLHDTSLNFDGYRNLLVYTNQHSCIQQNIFKTAEISHFFKLPISNQI
jgi:hypothetical protein